MEAIAYPKDNCSGTLFGRNLAAMFYARARTFFLGKVSFREHPTTLVKHRLEFSYVRDIVYKSDGKELSIARYPPFSA